MSAIATEHISLLLKRRCQQIIFFIPRRTTLVMRFFFCLFVCFVSLKPNRNPNTLLKDSKKKINYYNVVLLFSALVNTVSTPAASP